MVLLRPLLREIHQARADIQIRIISLMPGFIDELRKGKCDLVIWPPALPHEEIGAFTSETLFTDEFVAVVDRDHPEAGDSLTAAQLSTLPYVQVVNYSGTLSDTAFAKLGITLRVAATTEGFASAACLLPGTRMVTTMQRRLFEQLGAPLGLRSVPLEVPMPELVEAMYWHPQNTANAAHKWLREQIRKLSATL
jgi:DNA-binding transcriptional LysR family regulator